MCPKTKKKGFIRKLLEDVDENFFSFLSGIIANIPISLLFSFQSWGKTLYNHWFFIVQWIAFGLSVLLVGSIFGFTLKKIGINKEAQSEYERWCSKNKTTSTQVFENYKAKCVSQQKSSIITLSILFIVFFVLTVAAISVLWWLYSKI